MNYTVELQINDVIVTHPKWPEPKVLAGWTWHAELVRQLMAEPDQLRAEASRLQTLARTYVRTEGPDIEPGRALVVQAEYIGQLQRAITSAPTVGMLGVDISKDHPELQSAAGTFDLIARPTVPLPSPGALAEAVVVKQIGSISTDPAAQLREVELSQAIGELNRVREELRVTDQLLAERDRLLNAVPECPTHGAGCVPHAVEWVAKQTRVLTDDECAALTRAMWALDDPARHSDVEYGRAWVNCVTAALQQTHSKVTATTEKDAQGVDFGAAAQTRTGDLLITNQGGDCSETPQNQEDRQEQAPVATAESVRSGSSTYDPVTATPAAPVPPALRHKYADHDGTSDCANGCGCWLGPFRSGGPDGVDPSHFARCPKAQGDRAP